jgi:hypothetical protein
MLHCNHWSVGLRSPWQDTLQHFELNAALQPLVCRSPVSMSRHIAAFWIKCCIAITGQSLPGPHGKTQGNILKWMLLCNYWSVGPWSPCQDTLQHFELNVGLQSLVCRSPVPMARHIAAFWIECCFAITGHFWIKCCLAITGQSVLGPRVKTHCNILNAALQSLVCRSPVPMSRHIATFWLECCIAITGL